MKITSFDRVIAQAQQVLNMTQARLNSEGLIAAKKTYAVQMEEFNRWIAENVDTKVNVSPILVFMEVKPKRSTAAYHQEITAAMHRVFNMYNRNK